ncbi:MAG: hypothetical protein BLM47_09485 [Candidatus Reconcilbacillus cellulovorans]|uniref:Barstar (barnase inhibitor) domain-containing protein n=1 Tax=Candidatus Reconcilbacillus cellulovorans TaxID=1906605 RepID=A0A2A6DZ63_9BACL|nr:MAG: hypothetical protein BLM47_09485 [Candidatus Reconcilbacillus cellulovorans]
MKRVVIDGRTIAGEDDLHDLLARELGFPDYYGRNLDALWDGLTGWAPMPLEIVWTHVEASRRALGGRLDAWLELFRDAEARIDGFRFIAADGTT